MLSYKTSPSNTSILEESFIEFMKCKEERKNKGQ